MKLTLKIALIAAVFFGGAIYANGESQAAITETVEQILHIDNHTDTNLFISELDDHEESDHDEEDHETSGGGGRGRISTEDMETMTELQTYFDTLVAEYDWANMTDEEIVDAQLLINELIDEKIAELGLDFKWKPFDVEHDHDEEDHEEEAVTEDTTTDEVAEDDSTVTDDTTEDATTDETTDTTETTEDSTSV